jgi:hypothetical protein
MTEVIDTIIKGLYFIIPIVLFFSYEWYSKIWFWVLFVFLIIVINSEFIRHYTYQLVSILLGAIYLPLNMIFLKLVSLVEPFKKEDKIVYWIFRILLFPLQILVTIFSIPYEYILDHAH